MYVFFQDLFFKYTWNNFLHLQVELCVAAILRPCAHEMRLQPGFGSQEKIGPPQDALQEHSLMEAHASETSVSPENSAHNLMVTHVGVSAGVFKQEAEVHFKVQYRSVWGRFLNLNLLTLMFLSHKLFQHCRLVQRILQAWEENDKTQ